MKWSTVLPTASIGMRVTADHVVPFVDVLITMSFDEQPDRKRQSCHTTYTLPCGSISADGIGSVRRLPATPWSVTLATFTLLPQLLPPSVETKERMPPKLALVGTITRPLGCTSGWPPSPLAKSAVCF